MLTRLILFVLLAGSGLTANPYPRQGLLQRVRSGDLHDDEGAGGGVARCSDPKCANLSVRDREARMSFNQSDSQDNRDDFFKFWNDQDGDYDGDGTALEEGRGKKGKKKGMGRYIMVLAGITKAAMLYMMIHGVALLAGKALIVAKVALAIAIGLALKKTDHKTSYEIVKHPQYSHVQTHSTSVDYDHGGGYEGGSRRRRRA